MDVPCKQCPVLAVCVSKDHIECSIIDKWVSDGYKSFMEIKDIRIFLKKDHSYRTRGKLQLYNNKFGKKHLI